MKNLTAEEAREMHDDVVSQAAKNRAEWPKAGEFVDQVRDLFGGARVTYYGDPREDSIKRLQTKPISDSEETDAESTSDL